jgi:hypothetical protein
VGSVSRRCCTAPKVDSLITIKHRRSASPRIGSARAHALYQIVVLARSIAQPIELVDSSAEMRAALLLFLSRGRQVAGVGCEVVIKIPRDNSLPASLLSMLAMPLPGYGDDGDPQVQSPAHGDRVAFNTQPASRLFYPPFPGPKVRCSSKCHHPTP